MVFFLQELVKKKLKLYRNAMTSSRYSSHTCFLYYYYRYKHTGEAVKYVVPSKLYKQYQ